MAESLQSLTSAKPSLNFSTLLKRNFYVPIMEILGVLILAAMLAVTLYGGVKIADETKTIGSKVSTLDTQAKQTNTNSRSLNNQQQSSTTAAKS